LPLVAGVYEQGPLTYRVMESGVVTNGWRLEHDPLASFPGVDFDPEAMHDLEEFMPKHEYYSRSAESPWINLFLIRHRHETGSNELRGCIWSKRENDAIERNEIQTKSQWLEVLGDIFGEQLSAYSHVERDEIWKKVQKTHEEWKKAKGE
ncbi:MAG: arylamine N-acetyltransferase, partial [Clostridia bacterium]